MQFRFAAWLYSAAVLMPLAAAAQTTGLSPTHPDTAVPAAQYESAFTGYLPFRDEKLAPWRDVNDEAARVGGHLGIFRSASAHAGHGATAPAVQPTALVPKPSVPDAPPMMHGASHPGMKK